MTREGIRVWHRFGNDAELFLMPSTWGTDVAHMYMMLNDKVLLLSDSGLADPLCGEPQYSAHISTRKIDGCRCCERCCKKARLLIELLDSGVNIFQRVYKELAWDEFLALRDSAGMRTKL